PSKAGVVYGFNTEFILRTRDGGKTWDDATAHRPDPSKPDHWRGRGWNGWCSTDFEFNPYRQGQSVALAMDAARGWISDDGLKSWRYTMGQTHPWLGGQSVGFSEDGWIYITTGQFGSGNGIQRSADWGRTWTTLEGGRRGLPPAGWGNGKEFAGVYVHPDNGRSAWVALNGSPDRHDGRRRTLESRAGRCRGESNRRGSRKGRALLCQDGQGRPHDGRREDVRQHRAPQLEPREAASTAIRADASWRASGGRGAGACGGMIRRRRNGGGCSTTPRPMNAMPTRRIRRGFCS
ncbi:MAG: hypothetical protein ACOX3C_05975, partial [Bacilli bacterium]